MKWSHLIAIAALPLMAGCTGSQPGPVGTSAAALTADQCNYFEVDGKVRICHKTSSTKNPYTVLNISDNACINAHAGHAGDYVAANDPTCQGGGCLPEGAPVDNTLPCCESLSDVNGVCAAAGCAPGLTACGGACVDLNSDNSNCGSCGTSCTAPETCNVGSCAPSLSRRKFKTDINYLGAADTQRLHDELMRYRLATWRYKSQPEGGARHLGFMIDDVAPSASVSNGDGDSVDLYGYTSMAVAAIQLQDQQLQALREEVKALRARLDRKSPRRSGAR